MGGLEVILSSSTEREGIEARDHEGKPVAHRILIVIRLSCRTRQRALGDRARRLGNRELTRVEVRFKRKSVLSLRRRHDELERPALVQGVIVGMLVALRQTMERRPYNNGQAGRELDAINLQARSHATASTPHARARAASQSRCL